MESGSIFQCLRAALLLAGAGCGSLEDKGLVVGETFTIESRVLGETRRVNVFTPDGTEGALPVLLMLDGGVHEDFLHMAGLVQVCVGNGTLRPFRLVGIENTQRRRDLTGPTSDPEDRKIAPVVGGSAAFRRFLAEELLPEVGRRYRCTQERAIVGESLAGLFVVETLLLQPELFDVYLAVDPSLWWNKEEILKRASQPARGKKVFLASSSEPSLAPLVARLATCLGAQHVHFPAETHATVFHPAALQALRVMLRD